MNKKMYGVAVIALLLVAGFLWAITGSGNEKKTNETEPKKLVQEPLVTQTPVLLAQMILETTNITWGNETCDVWVKNLNPENKSVQIEVSRQSIYDGNLQSGEKRSFSLQYLIGNVKTEREINITVNGVVSVQERVHLDCTVSGGSATAVKPTVSPTVTATSPPTATPTVVPTPPPPVPEAHPMLLVGLGLLGLFAIIRLRK